MPVELARAEAFDGADFVFFAATGTLSKDLAPEAAKRGAVAIDKSGTCMASEQTWKPRSVRKPFSTGVISAM
ncbi:MAG: hypothetical protein ACREEG_12595 [Phenylobacterium sp.]